MSHLLADDLNIERPVPYILDQLCLVAFPATLASICVLLSQSDTSCRWLFGSGLALAIVAATRVIVVPARMFLATRRSGWSDRLDWVPWRYVILLAPIILYFLGFPQGLQSRAAAAQRVENRRQGEIVATLVAVSLPLPQLTMLPGAAAKRTIFDIDLQTLRDIANDEELRAAWDGMNVRAKGQYIPGRGRGILDAVRVGRIRTGSDHRDSSIVIPVVGGGEFKPVTRTGWICVAGRVEFFEGRDGGYQTILRIRGQDGVTEATLDPDP